MTDVPDTTWQRYMRKMREQPLIPIGVAATCVALIGATRKMQTGDRNSFNRWLRFRVLAQGLTVVAAVAGGWQINQERKAARQNGVAEAAQEELARRREEAERVRFEARMRAAEAAHREETQKGVK